MLGTLRQSSTCPLNVTSATFSISAYILNIGDLNAQCPTSANCLRLCVCAPVSGLTSLSRAAEHGLDTERKGERVNEWSQPGCCSSSAGWRNMRKGWRGGRREKYMVAWKCKAQSQKRKHKHDSKITTH